MTTRERRTRVARRHHLAPRFRAGTPLEVARGLVALHGTTASSVYLSAAARLRQPDAALMEDALYRERTLVRMLGMRRTMFVVAAEVAPIIQAACTRAIAVRERQRLVRLVEEAGIAMDGAAWLAPIERSTLRTLDQRGESTAAELGSQIPKLRTQIRLATGKAYEGTVSVGTRLLFVLAAEGRIVRLRPLGTWASSQFRWAPVGGKQSSEWASWTVAKAQVELLRRYLAAFGPATMADMGWWSGLTVGDVRRALEQIGTQSVELDAGPGLVLRGDLEATKPTAPWAALLPALDPTVMGWAGRDWYLGDHGRALFDRSGNAGPTIWWDGRVVGGWAQRRDGQIAFKLLEDIGSDGQKAVQAAAGRLQLWFGSVRVTPGFRTPLEKELAG